MFKPVFDAYSLMARLDKSKFVFLLFSRIFVQSLDLVGLALVGLLGNMLAAAIAQKSNTVFLGWQLQVDGPRDFILVVSLTTALFLLKSLLGSLLLLATTNFLAKVEAKVAGDVVRHLVSGGLEKIQTHSRGELLWIAGESANFAVFRMLFAGSALVSEAALFAAVFIAFLVVDPFASLVISAYFLILLGAFQLMVNQTLQRLGERLVHSGVGIKNSLLSISDSYREITVGRAANFYVKKFEAFRGRHASDQATQRFIVGLPRFLVEAALMVGVLGLVVWQFASGSLESSAVTTSVFLAGGVRIMAAFLPLQNALADIRTSGPQALKAQEIVRETHGAKPSLGSRDAEAWLSSSPEPPHQSGHSVRLKDVSHTYQGSTETALEKLSIEVRAGSLHALVGPSGGGKSTVADIVAGTVLPSGGKIFVDGKLRAGLNADTSERISYVPQKPGLVTGSIAENIALGLPAELIDIGRVAEVVELSGLAQSLVESGIDLETVVGEGGRELSGGQRQRLGLARALYAHPRLLILDEATSALDMKSEATISSLLRDLKKTTTILVVAHRMTTVRAADYVSIIENGHLSATGTFSEVKREHPLLREYLRLSVE